MTPSSKLLILLLVLMAGCASVHSPPSASSTTQASPSSSSTAPPPPPPPMMNGTYSHLVKTGDCQGWHTIARYPDHVTHAQQDPTWPAVSGPITEVQVWAFFCKRVSWGPFERPLSILIEDHDYENAPESCFPQGSAAVVQLRTLASIWVNDAQVASYLKQTYGMPVYYSPILLSNQTLGTAVDHVTTWGVNGSMNQLNILDEHSQPNPETDNERLFWSNQTAVASMDLEFNLVSETAIGFTAFVDRPAYGTLYPPMLAADVNSNYAGIGTWNDQATLDGTIQKYHDHNCKEPWN